jgi:hypothetical protein
MRAGLFILLVGLAGTAFAGSGDPTTYYVRYAVNMDFLPPLIGEKSCVHGEACEIVHLDHFSLILVTLDREGDADAGRLTIHCLLRACALRDGQRSAKFRKKSHLVRFDVDDREYSSHNLAVIRSRGNLIGEILLAY